MRPMWVARGCLYETEKAKTKQEEEDGAEKRWRKRQEEEEEEETKRAQRPQAPLFTPGVHNTILSYCI